MAKRILFVVMFLALWSAFAASAEKQVLFHYHWTETVYDGINQNAVKQFEKDNPNVEVKMVLLPDGDRANVIRTVLAAKGSIDTFALNNGESAEFLSAGQAVPIIPAAFGKSSIDEVVRMWTPGAIATCGGVWKGQYYGIPFELSNYVGWINVADMKEAGLNPATDKPKTWDQFVSVAQKLIKMQGNTRVRNGFMCNSKEGVFNFLVLTAMMEQLGLDWGSEQGLVASMDNTEALTRGLKTYTDLVVASKVWDPALDDNDREGFGNNKSGMFLTGGTWYWGVLDTYSVKRKDVEPFPYPRFADGKDIGGVGYGYCLYVSKLAKDPTLAFKFLDAMASQPNEFIKQGYHQPRVTLSNGQQALDPTLARKYIPYYDQVFRGELAKTAVWLSSTKGAQVTSAVWDAISKVIYQGTSVDDAVSGMQNDIKAIYQ
ncbi:MAG TPA: extracellular solute-binding protein [Spirochaetia bacterium]|nr:extracellular solute-binding protein [Spirochaetia bacterium]